MPPRLVFIHHARTGGTTLHEAWSAAFPPDAICPERFARLHEYAPAALAPYRFFSGHFRFDQMWMIPHPRIIVTVLRDPVERVLSLYHYWRRFRPDFIERHGLTGPRLARERGLLSFLRSTEAEVTISIDNAIACHLAGNAMPLGEGRFGTLTSRGADPLEPEVVLDKARAALQACDWVGETNALDALHARVAPVIGLAPGPLPRRNSRDTTNPYQEEAREEPVTPEIAETLARLTRLDAALLAFAREDAAVRRA